MNCRKSWLTTGGDSTVRISPLIRNSGEAPVCRCTSEAPCSAANRINCSKFMIDPLREGRRYSSPEDLDPRKTPLTTDLTDNTDGKGIEDVCAHGEDRTRPYP